MQVRLGLPSSFKRFSIACQELGAPILVSANAFRKRDQSSFRTPSPTLFSGVPVALDSAGFIAQHLYGGFPWSVEAYVNLAAAYPWDWWASMDLCCEPEIASNPAEVQRRQHETLRLLRACREEAKRKGINPPMPVLQGWRPRDYERFVEMMGEPLPPLVGLGSVCRRHLSGSSGLLAIVDRLDKKLPAGVRLHLFGVKGTAIAKLAQHPRIHSVDSMAWDMSARYKARKEGKSKSIALRIAVLRQWYERQVSSLPQEANGKSVPKDMGARYRQREARQRHYQAGNRQLNLWLDQEQLSWLESYREEGESLSACVKRLLVSKCD